MRLGGLQQSVVGAEVGMGCLGVCVRACKARGASAPRWIQEGSELPSVERSQCVTMRAGDTDSARLNHLPYVFPPWSGFLGWTK